MLPSEVKIGMPPTVEITGAVKAYEYSMTIKVVDQSSYELAAQELQDVKARFARLEDARVALKKPVIDAGRAIDAFFNEAIRPLGNAEETIKRVMLTYQQEEQRKVDEARRKQEEEARKARIDAERVAREAREKAEAEARRQREEAARKQREADEAEARARAAKERGDKEEAARAERDRKAAEEAQRRAQERAEKATDKGDAQAAKALAQAAEIAARPVETPAAPVAQGVSVRGIWKHRVVDQLALIRACAENRTPYTALIPNDKALAQAAKSLKGEMSKFYPGVESYEEKGIASRSA